MKREVASRYRWVIIGVLWTAYIVAFMHRLSIGPLGPFLKEEMGLTSTQVGSLMSAASFGYMLSILPAGLAVDRMGVRRLLVAGEVVGGIFMLGIFLTPSYELALVFMASSGLGYGCLMPSTTKGVMVWFPVNERATVMGIKHTGANIGGVITAAVLPGIALALGWRFGFLFLGILAIVIGIISFIIYKDPPASTVSYPKDNSGFTDAATSVSSQRFGELLKTRDIWLIALAGFIFGLAQYAVVAHLVLYLTEVLFLPVVTAGILLAVTLAGGVLGQPGGGFISDRLFGGNRRKVFILWSGIAAAMLVLIAIAGAKLFWGLYPILFILGMTAVGWGAVYVTLVAELAGSKLVGTAVGAAGVVSMTGFILGPILFGYIVDITGSYQLAWLSAAGYAVLCVVALLFVREERRDM